MSERQQKQKFFRQNIAQDQQEDFYEFLVNQGIQADIDGWSLQYIKQLVGKFKAIRAKQQKQQSHERSFANYQTANVVQALSIVAAINNSQKNKPSKPGEKSATDLLDSVFQVSQTQRQISNNSPTKSPPDNKNFQKQYSSNFNVSPFEKGNIWATTTNVNAQRKSAQFNNFWQFPTTVNANKPQPQQYKTEKPVFFNGSKQQTNSLDSQQQKGSSNNFSFQPYKKSPEVNNKAISFDQLTKKVNMTKKSNPTVQNAQRPSNMKKQEPNLLNFANGNNQQTTSNKPTQQQPNYSTTNPNINNSNKQIKLISQKPLSQEQVSSNNMNMGTNKNLNEMGTNKNNVNFTSGNMKIPTSNLATAYKNKKISYQGPTVHRSQFKDTVKCYQAPRRQLIDKNIQIIIQKHEIVQRNFFVKDYVMYYLSVKPLNRVCKRNYQDFTKLRSALQKFYPGMQLPYLQKNTFFQTSAQNIKKQKHMLEFFLKDLCSNPQVRNSRIFQDFITFADHKGIKRKFQQYAKMDQYKSLQQLCIVQGKVSVVINQSQRVYHQQLSQFLDAMQDLMGKKAKLMQMLGTQFCQIHQTLSSLAKLSTEICQQSKKFNQRVSDDQFPSLQNTFNIITKSYQEWATRISFESKVVQKRLVPFYQYQRNNLQTMRGLLTQENTFFRNYMKKAGNETGGTSNSSYLSDSTKAFKTGVLDPSTNTLVLKYQLGYLSNMVCKQASRFFQLMAQNFRDKWIYQAQKYNQRLNKDVQFYNSLSGMAR